MARKRGEGRASAEWEAGLTPRREGTKADGMGSTSGSSVALSVLARQEGAPAYLLSDRGVLCWTGRPWSVPCCAQSCLSILGRGWVWREGWGGS